MFLGPFDPPFFFQAEDGIRDRSPSRGLGDVYKRQGLGIVAVSHIYSVTEHQLCAPLLQFVTDSDR